MLPAKRENYSTQRGTHPRNPPRAAIPPSQFKRSPCPVRKLLSRQSPLAAIIGNLASFQPHALPRLFGLAPSFPLLASVKSSFFVPASWTPEHTALAP